MRPARLRGIACDHAILRRLLQCRRRIVAGPVPAGGFAGPCPRMGLTLLGGPSWTACKRGAVAPRSIRSDRSRASQEMQVAEPLAVVGRADIEPRPCDG